MPAIIIVNFPSSFHLGERKGKIAGIKVNKRKERGGLEEHLVGYSHKEKKGLKEKEEQERSM